MAVKIVPFKSAAGNLSTFASVATAKSDVPAVKVKVVKETAGPVTFFQKLAGYYKGLIGILTGILVVVNELTPILNFLPGQDKQYITAAIAIVGGALTILKSNEHWVDEL